MNQTFRVLLGGYEQKNADDQPDNKQATNESQFCEVSRLERKPSPSLHGSLVSSSIDAWTRKIQASGDFSGASKVKQMSHQNQMFECNTGFYTWKPKQLTTMLIIGCFNWMMNQICTNGTWLEITKHPLRVPGNYNWIMNESNKKQHLKIFPTKKKTI